MTISYGNLASYTTAVDGGGSFTGPIISGSNTYLIVGLSLNGYNEPTPTTITYNSVSMTSLGTIRGGNFNRVAVYGVVNPESQKTIAYSGNFGKSVVIAAYYTGVNQSTPTRTATTAGGNPTTATANVTNSQSGDLLVGFFGTDDTSLSNAFTQARLGSGQTYRTDLVNNTDEVNLALCEKDGASGTVTVSWNYAGSYDWSEVVVPLIPAVVSSASVPPHILDSTRTFAPFLVR